MPDTHEQENPAGSRVLSVEGNREGEAQWIDLRVELFLGRAFCQLSEER
jgi:hypothetical protein